MPTGYAHGGVHKKRTGALGGGTCDVHGETHWHAHLIWGLKRGGGREVCTVTVNCDATCTLMPVVLYSEMHTDIYTKFYIEVRAQICEPARRSAR